MLKKIHLSVILISISLTAYAASTSSPWDHQGAELSQAVTIVPGTSPITYSSTFTREREMFGYRPRFMPMKVNFDKNNRPYISTTVHPTNIYNGNQSATFSAFTTDKLYIQTLNDSGSWIVYDVGEMLKSLFPSYYVYTTQPSYMGGTKHKDDVLFSDDGKTVYFGFYERNRRRKMLIYSNDGFATYRYADVDGIGISTAMFETFDTFLSTERYLPTVINSYRDEPVTLYELTSDSVGNIMQLLSVPVSPAGIGTIAPLHSGTLNASATVGEVVHCVWFDESTQTITDYTNQYYSSYNRRTGEVTEPVYLGSTFGDYYGEDPYISIVDVHNGPVITVGRDKTIHVVLGGHHSQSIYRYSEDGGKSWSASYDLPGGNAANTYPAIITDRENTLHLVYRWSIDGRRLAYARKKQGQDWEHMGALVVPYWWGHGQYAHNLTVDRLGRLFVTYWYSATSSTGLPTAIQAEYDAKWPGQDAQLAHDPVIIMSDNGGDTWKIATTADFVNGIIDDTIPVAVYNFDSAGDIGLDMAGYDNNLNTAYGSPSAINGVIDGAVSFNGTADGLKGELDQAKAFVDGAFTVVGWFKPDAVPSGASNVVNAKTGDRGLALSINDGQWIGYTYADGYIQSVIANADTSVGQWVHVAFTYQPTSIPDNNGAYTGTSKLYISGQLVSTSTGRKYNPQGAETIAVGMNTGGSGFFACSVDELGIFKGAMPAQKIAELAANDFRPSNVSRELLYNGDLNGDGFVNADDLMIFAASWLDVN